MRTHFHCIWIFCARFQSGYFELMMCGELLHGVGVCGILCEIHGLLGIVEFVVEFDSGGLSFQVMPLGVAPAIGAEAAAGVGWFAGAEARTWSSRG